MNPYSVILCYFIGKKHPNIVEKIRCRMSNEKTDNGQRLKMLDFECLTFLL